MAKQTYSNVERDLTLEEVKIVYAYLQEQIEMVNSQSKTAIEHNDYVKLKYLIDYRKQLLVAIHELEDIYGTDLHVSPMQVKVNSMNQSLQKTARQSVKWMIKRNVKSQQMIKACLSKTASGLYKLADVLQNKS
ncbi:hypothetical protein [Paraliobacillus ryukyuensis]|uniref:hypothetical protein n=1 Tax=Paraliobacillus ryukyuensis TaxID=200904 RepID=UPI0009A584D3|nr:hypothetical protein [Paraliobacillus ryukyuensis]